MTRKVSRKRRCRMMSKDDLELVVDVVLARVMEKVNETITKSVTSAVLEKVREIIDASVKSHAANCPVAMQVAVKMKDSELTLWKILAYMAGSGLVSAGAIEGLFRLIR